LHFANAESKPERQFKISHFEGDLDLDLDFEIVPPLPIIVLVRKSLGSCSEALPWRS
jgi:hypothetical protein